MSKYLEPRHQKQFICLFLIASSLVVYGQVNRHEFVNFDDNIYVTENRHVQSGLTREGLVWAFTFSDKDKTYWHPLTWLSHMLDSELFGLNPMGHHWTNVLIHTANTILMFLALKLMTGALWESAFVAALFALHPLNVESVAWVSERKNVLSTFFWMLTLLSYTYYCRRGGNLRYLLTLMVFTLGLLAKPMLVTLPCVLLLLDYWPLGRVWFRTAAGDVHNTGDSPLSGYATAPISRLLLEKVPFLLFSVFSIFLSTVPLRNQEDFISTGSVSMTLRMANTLVSYVKYIWKMIWPKNLAVLYPYPKTMLPVWQVAGAGLLLVCVSVLVMMALKRAPYLSVGWLWYVGTLVPVIGLVQVGLWPAMADRWAYVPMIGLYIIIAWSISDITSGWRSRKVALAVLAGMVLSALTICTWFQVRHWQNSLTLFRHTLKVTRDNMIAHYYLGYALDQNGELDEAITQYSKSLQLNPGDKRIHIDIGIALARKGAAQKAIYHFDNAIRIDPEYAPAYYNLGKVYWNQGKTGEAISCYRHALRVNPDMTQVLYNLSWIFATHENGIFRNGKEAVALAERLCTLTHSQQPLALDALAAACAEAGEFEKAVKTAQKAYEMALRDGMEELALNSKTRLKLYQTGRPYRQTTGRVAGTTASPPGNQ